MISRVSHVTILVKNQDEAIRFYTEKLGFKIHTDASFGDMRWLTICPASQPDFEIALMQAPEHDMHLVGRQAGDHPLCAVEVEDCRASYAAMKANGVEFMGEPTDEAWGTGVVFKDLYGSLFYMNQSPK